MYSQTAVTTAGHKYIQDYVTKYRILNCIRIALVQVSHMNAGSKDHDNASKEQYINRGVYSTGASDFHYCC